ncbi:hypothetical protein SAMN00790413_04703 [Deinococcus hopiensis KR-140]|uniref:Uncharacterized protein n=2 Tax=Deinococcus TaxID=1298 RepID=A0A1W1UKU0_9DEIO|nr:hypothetical protein SAMN00790413_04703 [Deinococcus hopiensis KR-140]
MDVERFKNWLEASRQDVEKNGVHVQVHSSNELSMDPDIVFKLESNTVLATIGIWSGLQEAELHAIAMEAIDSIALYQIRLINNKFDVLFRPIITLFKW